MAELVVYAHDNSRLVRSYSTTSYALARSGGDGLEVYASTINNYGVGQRYGAPTWTVYESFLQFDTSSIPNGASIESVTLSLNQIATPLADTDFTIEARALDWGGTVETTDYVPGASLSGYTLLASMDTTGKDSNQYYDLTSETAFLAAINKTGYTRLFLSGSRTRTGDTPTGEERWHFDSEETSGSEPTLTVVYNVEPGDATTAFERSVSGTSSSGSSTAAVDLSACAVDELALVLITRNVSTDPTTTPTGWTQLAKHAATYSGSTYGWLLYYKVLEAGDIGTVTWTFAASSNTLAYAAIYSGADVDVPIADWSKGTLIDGSSGKTLNLGSVTSDEAMLVALAAVVETATRTYNVSTWTDWVERVDAGDTAPDWWMLIADSNGTHAGGAFTPSTSTEYVNLTSSYRAGFLVAIRDDLPGKSLGSCAVTITVADATPQMGRQWRCDATITVCDSMPTLRAGRVPPTMSASVTIRVATRFPYLHAGGESLPANDGTGWTVPDETPPDILSMRVKIGNQTIPNARIVSFPMQLSDRGGYDSATLTLKLKRPGEYNFPWHAALVVTYKDTQLFRGRLEESTCEVGDDLTRTLVFTGPICKLDDHQAFRRVYVDSDLDSWNTDQGPQTHSNAMEVGAT